MSFEITEKTIGFGLVTKLLDRRALEYLIARDEIQQPSAQKSIVSCPSSSEASNVHDLGLEDCLKSEQPQEKKNEKQIEKQQDNHQALQFNIVPPTKFLRLLKEVHVKLLN
ncbi:unnamed protein product [Paramecium sonneborni]|uniref:Uncharacterized protein n=1 Tax=Paramecium sonneborni TaxID=65129 RepID=A0A8S1RRP6_9CILI|nr:unnamed protein product [Paramecium sonneborni]